MSLAVIIPCYNEETTIENVIKDYMIYFDAKDIYIMNNNSTDKSVEIAKQYDVNVLNVYRQGKGAVLKYAFDKFEVDYLILTDCDSTYSAQDSFVLYQYILSHNYDMVVGNRLNSGYFNNHQKFNGFGNRLFSNIASKKMKTYIADLMSGSRVLSKACYKNLNIKHSGFEIETEITLQTKNIAFLDIDYRARPENSHSSLNSIIDGFKILRVLLKRSDKRCYLPREKIDITNLP